MIGVLIVCYFIHFLHQRGIDNIQQPIKYIIDKTGAYIAPNTQPQFNLPVQTNSVLNIQLEFYNKIKTIDGDIIPDELVSYDWFSWDYFI